MNIKQSLKNKKTKFELKREQERLNNELIKARQAKDEELIKQYAELERTDDNFNSLDSEIQDLIDRTTEAPKAKRNVDFKGIAQIASPIAVAAVTGYFGLKATNNMIKASQGEDYIDDKPLNIWKMIGKR
jgi:hypothetical protein